MAFLSVNNTWRELYEALSDSRNELLKKNRLILEAKNNPEQEADSRLMKAQGELSFKKSQFQKLPEQYSQQGNKMAELEEQLATMKKESPENVPTFTVRRSNWDVPGSIRIFPDPKRLEKPVA